VQRLLSYLSDSWVDGAGEGIALLNPSTEERMAQVSTAGLDLAPALAHARRAGGGALRGLNFAQRAGLLQSLATVITENREELLHLAVRNGGNTRGDAKFDVDGAAATLTYYASLGRKRLGERSHLLDGEWEQLGRTPRYFAHHVLTARAGVAVLINAFNFPAWGMCEKVATAILAGMPVLVKPAPATALVAVRIVELAVAKQIFPPGALSLLSGEPVNLLDCLEPADVVAFTGSNDTAQRIASHPALLASGARFTAEADSLNAAILGPDVDPSSDFFFQFVQDVAREITQKAGQKCTALRRIFAPEAALPELRSALVERLSGIVSGNPEHRDVAMGPVVSAVQRDRVEEGIRRLAYAGERVTPALVSSRERPGAPEGRGFFVDPTLLFAGAAPPEHPVHRLEVFGPVATLLAYDGTAADAAERASWARGSLLAAVYSEDKDFVAEVLPRLSPHHGRVYWGHPKITEDSIGSGAVLPQLVHGGPGRAGGGEELGGLRGLHHYMQRTAVQGYRPLLEKVLGGGEG
jgi:oxepin-CoA hydrolase/3-oxo-5,6-dehydrosuberyl-CoA semialdehyde dehydrogenase